MVSNRSKGFRYERKCEFDLRKDGWIVERVKGSTRFNKSVDFFGLWDCLALKKEDNKTRVKFVQVKTNKFPDWKLLNKFKKDFPGLEYEAWTYWERGVRKKKQGWEKAIL